MLGLPGRRPAGYAAALFQALPLTRVVFTDRSPEPSPFNRSCNWLRADGGPDNPHRAHPAVYDRLTTRPDRYGRRYRQAGSARDALSAACVAYGRHLAGLPPLPDARSVEGRETRACPSACYCRSHIAIRLTNDPPTHLEPGTPMADTPPAAPPSDGGAAAPRFPAFTWEVVEHLAAEYRRGHPDKAPRPAPAGGGPAGPRTRSPVDARLAARVRAYLAKRDPAVWGKGGDNETFETACYLVIDFDLTPDEA